MAKSFRALKAIFLTPYALRTLFVRNVFRFLFFKQGHAISTMRRGHLILKLRPKVLRNLQALLNPFQVVPSTVKAEAICIRSLCLVLLGSKKLNISIGPAS